MKKKIKRIFCLVITVMAIISLTACGNINKKIIGSWELTETEEWSELFYSTLNLYEEGSWDHGTWELDGEILELTYIGYKQNPNVPDIIRYTVCISGDQMTLTTHDIERAYTKCSEDTDSIF